MIRMRKEVPEISWGDFSFVRTRNPEILAMRYDWKNNGVLFLHNLQSEPREVRFYVDYEEDEEHILVNLLSEEHSHPEKGNRHCVLMEPYGYRWFRIGGLDYLLKRSTS